MHKPDADIDALIRSHAGAEALAEAVVQQHYDRLYRLCISILAEPGDADDAAQEAVIAALADIERYEPGTSFRAWLSRIAVHKCYGLLRRRKRRQAIDKALRLVRPDAHPSSAARSTAPYAVSNNELNAAVSDLGLKHQIVIRLRYMDGLPIGEIAGILDVPEGTVHSRLHYAIRKLRRALRD